MLRLFALYNSHLLLRAIKDCKTVFSVDMLIRYAQQCREQRLETSDYIKHILEGNAPGKRTAECADG